MDDMPAEMTTEEFTKAQWNATSEAVLARRIERSLRENGWEFYHTEFSIRSEGGYPDYHCIRGGDEFYLELKTEYGKMTEKQHKWRDLIVGAGGEWHCIRPSSENEIIDRMMVPYIEPNGVHVCSTDMSCGCLPRQKQTRKKKLST